MQFTYTSTFQFVFMSILLKSTSTKQEFNFSFELRVRKVIMEEFTMSQRFKTNKSVRRFFEILMT